MTDVRATFADRCIVAGRESADELVGVRSLGGSRWETIRSVTLPGALPYILTGIRSGLGFGWRALIAAELVGATTGLGQLIFSGAEYHRAHQGTALPH